MDRKSALLTIGDMSKLTGASIRSLRYYDKLELLRPVFIDPDTNYRYYSFEQSNIVEIIMFCIELDIPLKELPQYVGTGETMDYRAFLAQGKEIANKKIKALRSGLNLINSIETQMDLSDKYDLGQIYNRDVPEKYIVCKPCKPPLSQLDRYELVMSFISDPGLMDLKYDLMEYGFICEHSQLGTRYYAFVEVPRRFAKACANNYVMKLPAATYLCRQDDNTQIEKTREFFYENFAGSFIAVETEIFASKPKISKPLIELRVLPC